MAGLRRPLALASSLVLGLSVVGVAQDAPVTARAVLRGTVQDLSGAPLEGAEVEVLGFGRKATTPATGAYRVSVPGGRSWVIVRRIGFEPLRVALTFEPGQDRRVIFQLDRRPQRLADVEGHGRQALGAALRGFCLALPTGLGTVSDPR